MKFKRLGDITRFKVAQLTKELRELDELEARTLEFLFDGVRVLMRIYIKKASPKYDAIARPRRDRVVSKTTSRRPRGR